MEPASEAEARRAVGEAKRGERPAKEKRVKRLAKKNVERLAKRRRVGTVGEAGA